MTRVTRGDYNVTIGNTMVAKLVSKWKGVIEIIQIICFIYLGIRLNAPVWYYILLGYAALDSVVRLMDVLSDGMVWKDIGRMMKRGRKK